MKSHIYQTFYKEWRAEWKMLVIPRFYSFIFITRYYSSITGVFLQTRKRSLEKIADKFKMFAIFEREPNFRTPFLPTTYLPLQVVVLINCCKKNPFTSWNDLGGSSLLQAPYCHHRYYVPLHPHHSDVRNLITRWASALHFYSNTIEVQYFLHSFLHPSSPRAVVIL